MRFLTAGESHGLGLTIIIDNVPAKVPVSADVIGQDLARRQLGYGRGGRMHIEKDQAKITSGIRFGETTGAPIALWVENRDAKNWLDVMAADGNWSDSAETKKFVRPRPGHADLAGYFKYGHTDLRDVLERASARETTARVAAGSVAKQLLACFGIEVFSHVTSLGGIQVSAETLDKDYTILHRRAESNEFRCGGSDDVMAEMKAKVDEARMAGTTLGGEVEIVVLGLPPGLGSYVQWDRKLDGQLAQAIMSVHAVKAVSVGSGNEGSERAGHDFHDEIRLTSPSQEPSSEASHIIRPTNRAGGLEGGVTNGAPLVLKAVMKPIATLRTALTSVNLETQQEESAHFERSDVTAVPACGVVCEAMVALVLAKAFLEKFGQDNVGDIQRNLAGYMDRLKLSPASYLSEATY
jgi:chorismate synthase